MCRRLRKRTVLSRIAGILLFVVCFAIGMPARAQSVKSLSLTIYNNDRATIREVRSFSVNRGRSRFLIQDVPALLDPTSVFFRPLGQAAGKFGIIEQSFRKPILDDREFLFKHIGSDVTIRTRQNLVISGTILGGPYQYPTFNYMGRPITAYDCKFLTLKPKDGTNRFVILPFDELDHLQLKSSDKVSRLKPQLSWLAESSVRGKQDAEIAYQTSGMSWEADYSLHLAQDAQSAFLQALVTVENRSGRSFKKAKLKLVAGDVQLFKDEFGKEYSEYDLDVREESMRTEETAGIPKFDERGFSGYHLYELRNAVDLGDLEAKQIPLVEKPKIALDHFYVYDGKLMDALAGMIAANGPEPFIPKIDEYISFKNTQESGLGVPLPKGKIRIFRNNEKGQEFLVARDVLGHTAADAEVTLRLGPAEDLVGERRRINVERLSAYGLRESIEIRLHNKRNYPVEVRVVEHPERSGDWQIAESSDPYLKKSAQTVEFRVAVQPNSSQLLACTIEYRSPIPNIRSRGHRGYNFGDLIAGVDALRQGKSGEAISFFEAVVSRDPEDADGWTGLGNAYIQNNNMQKAIDSFQNVIRIDPEDLNAHGQLGWCYLQIGRLDESLLHGKMQVALNPGQSRPQVLLAEIYAARGEYEPAERAIREAIQVDGDKGSVRAALGKVHYLQGNLQEADNDFREAVSESEEPVLLNDIAWFLAERSDPGPMAVDYARRSLKLIEAGIALSSSQGLSKTSEQEGLLRLKGAVLDTLGWAYARAGDLDAAEKALLDSLNTGAYEIVAMDHLAQVYEKKGSAADAIQYYVKAVKGNRENSEIRARLEHCYRSLHGSLDGLDDLLNRK